MRLVKALAIVLALTLWSFSALATEIYAITDSGDMLYYDHFVKRDGSSFWGIQAQPIDHGWRVGPFQEVFAGANGAIYVTTLTGKLLLYIYNANPLLKWAIQAQPIGHGWNFKQVFASNDGSIYAITPSGDLLYYLTSHRICMEGEIQCLPGMLVWSIQAQPIGHGWDFKQVFEGSGYIYAITYSGDLLVYKQLSKDLFAQGVDPNAAIWSIQARPIGHGWNFKQVFAGDHNTIYAITQSGDLLLYRHDDIPEAGGSPNWSIQARPIGHGWDFRRVFAGKSGLQEPD